MDFSALLAEKDAEILSLRAEIAELKSKLEEKDLEEIAFDNEVSGDEEPMILKLPQEPEDQDANMFQDPNALMQFMQLMMMNNNNTQMGQEDEQEDEYEVEEPEDDYEVEEQEDDFEIEEQEDDFEIEEEMPELESIDDVIPESE
jgi:hypothetical protein